MTNMEMMLKAWNHALPEAFTPDDDDLERQANVGSDCYCDCRRCLKGDPGGCLDAEAIWQSQVDRGIIHELDYFIAKDENGVAL